ncbi:hypothetical protein [Smaragdicoccus niigatensis]|uniref:hypothetical protein n=1 Tax=Smaragdicoccus niigatensis TaxID=359359 RepID=UPI00037F7DAA|nr:hypothetical protein [Smaragdicoccus niigatensis]
MTTSTLERVDAPQARPLANRVAGEITWSFRPPRRWLEGVVANVVLSIGWLVISPLTGHSHRDWVVLVGTYFATFVLADVTTTNVLGLDAERLSNRLREGEGIGGILLVKNLTLLVIVGIPTLLLTAGMTIAHESPDRLAVTLPLVCLPILAWMGVGNVVSVLLTVAPRSLKQRWAERRQLHATVPWLAHLALPYVLYYLIRPLDGEPRLLPRELMHQLSMGGHALVTIGGGLAFWIAGTIAAVFIVRQRGLRFY